MSRISGKINNFGKRVPKQLWWLLEAFLITLALNVVFKPIPWDGTAEALLSGMSKLSRSFNSIGGAGIALTVGLYYALRYAALEVVEKDRWACWLSAIFAVLYVLARSSHENGSFAFLLDNGYQMLLSLVCIFAYWRLFNMLVKIAFYKFETDIPGTPEDGRKLFLCSFLIIFLCWLPWMVGNYPATVSYDSSSQLRQFLGITEFTAHHPPLSTLIMGSFVTLGEELVDRSFGAFLYVMTQSLLGAAVFALCIKKMNEMKLGRGWKIAVLLFYAINPLWGAYAQWMEKSMMYAISFILCVLLALNIIEARQCSRKQALLAVIVFSLAVFLRNNGLYEVFPLLLAMCLYLKGRDRKRIAAVSCSVLLLSLCVSNVLYPALNIKKGSIREMLSIPFCQTANYVINCGDEVTEYERDVIDSVLVYDELKPENYQLELSDYIKDTYREDSSKLPAYFKVWFQMFLKHPRIYVEAFALRAHGYIAPASKGFDAVIYDFGHNGDIDIYRSSPDTVTAFFTVMKLSSEAMPCLKLVWMPGIYTWVQAVCIVALFKKKKPAAALPFIPCVMNVLVCIASPISNSTRYALPMIAITPLLLAWTVMNVREQKVKEVCIESRAQNEE